MRAVTRRLALSLVVVALAALAGPGPAGAAEVYEIYDVPTAGGATIRIEVVRDSAKTSVPVVLTMSPYNTYSDALAPEKGRPASDGDTYVSRGYAYAVADLLGTRGSTGCWDYGGAKEVQAGLDAVMFLAKQSWSNGRVGMIGASYDGTIANGVASLGDKVRDEQGRGLHAIVPIVAISRWYGYAYSQGMRYTLQSTDGDPTSQGIDTPLVFDFRSGRTVAPPNGTNGQQFAANAAARANECGAVEHTSEGYDESPDYDAFWQERDYLAKAANFRVPVLIGAGWQDYNVKMDESTRLYRALPVDDPATTDVVEGVPLKRMVIQQMGHGVPSICNWQTNLFTFFDRYLKGDTTKKPASGVCSQGRTDTGSDATRTTPDWPALTNVELPLGRGATGGVVGSAAPGAPVTFTDLGVGDEVAALEDPATERSWLWYQSAPLAAATRIMGDPIVRAAVTLTRDRGTLTPVLVDIGPNGDTTIVTRGFADLRYRDGLTAAKAVPAGTPVSMDVELKPQDYTFKAGHRIGVLLLASNTLWVRPDLPGQATTVHHGAGGLASTLRLPVVGPAPTFAAPALLP